MQFRLSTIVLTAALFFTSVTPALSDSKGIGSPPGQNALAHRKIVRSFKNNNAVVKRANGSPGTYYNILMGEVACGGYYHPDDHIVAMNSGDFNNGEACGKTITISYNGVTAQATVRDECPTCDGPEGIDMTEGLFQLFAPLSVGEIRVNWWWGGSKPAPTTKAPPPPPPPPTTTWHPPPTTHTTSTTTWSSSSLSSPTTVSSSSAAPVSTPIVPSGANNIANLLDMVVELGQIVLSAAIDGNASA